MRVTFRPKKKAIRTYKSKSNVFPATRRHPRRRPVSLHTRSHPHIYNIACIILYMYIFGLRIVIFYCTHIFTPPQVCAHVWWFAGKNVLCRGREKSFVIENLVNETEVFSLPPQPPRTFSCKSATDSENSATANSGALLILSVRDSVATPVL